METPFEKWWIENSWRAIDRRSAEMAFNDATAAAEARHAEDLRVLLQVARRWMWQHDAAKSQAKDKTCKPGCPYEAVRAVAARFPEGT